MTPAPFSSDATVRPMSWLGRTEAWLDERGKGAWIAAMVVGFILFWPIGLALLAYMIWSKRMFSGNCSRTRIRSSYGSPIRTSSGNTAFDAYRADTLRRLEEEQEAFQAFLERLRAAKDQSEFDAFMDERASAKPSRDDDGDEPTQPRGPSGDPATA